MDVSALVIEEFRPFRQSPLLISLIYLSDVSGDFYISTEHINRFLLLLYTCNVSPYSSDYMNELVRQELCADVREVICAHDVSFYH